MATITDKGIIQIMLDNDGTYPGDPQAYSIWEYKSPEGQIQWAVFHGPEHDMYFSPWVKEPKLLWDREKGLHKE